jgi:hypothetical protein
MRWARVSNDEAFGLRRGAWYPVVGDAESALVLLDVNKSNRPVNRSNLQFTEAKPSKWSVVRRNPKDHAALRASSARLGPIYGVCPLCRARLALAPDTRRAPCPRCKEVSEVDWDNPC